MQQDLIRIGGETLTCLPLPTTATMDPSINDDNSPFRNVDNDPVTILNNASNRFEVNEKHDFFNVTAVVHSHDRGRGRVHGSQVPSISLPTIQCINNANTSNFAVSGAIDSSNFESKENGRICETEDEYNNREQEQSQTECNVIRNESEIEALANSDRPTSTSTSTPIPRRTESEPTTATYTSTEAQTDFLTNEQINSQETAEEVRQRRRRERRQRRHQRRFLHNFNTDHTLFDYRLLPDLVTMNPAAGPPPIPPPPYYSTLRSNAVQHPNQNHHQQQQIYPNLMSNNRITSTATPSGPVPVPVPIPSSSPPSASSTAAVVVPNTVVPFPLHLPGEIHNQLLQGSNGQATSFRLQYPSNLQFHRSRFGSRYSSEDGQKSCCGLVLTKPSSLRYFIALVALTAVCCVLVGTVLGAMRPSGRDHLTISLLMIGVGVIMIAISAVTWRLTTQSSACSALFGLRSADPNESFTRHYTNRLPPSYGRPHHPYATMVYPEFVYRPPPPSYQASMQEYRLRLLLLERGCINNSFFQPNFYNAQQFHNVTPPPTYRSNTNSLLRAPMLHRRGDSVQTNCSDVITHNHTDQNNSLTNNASSMVNVVNILTNHDDYTYKTPSENGHHLVADVDVDDITRLSPLKLYLKSASLNDLVLNDNDDTNEPDHNESKENNNLVTIVQRNDQNPVIVTVSGPAEPSSITYSNDHQSNILHVSSDLQMLAHL